MFQLVAYKKCKMAVKAYTFFYKRTDGTMASALCYLCSLCSYVFRGKRYKGEQPLKEQNKVRLLPMVIAFQSMKYVFGVTKSPFGVPIHYVHVVDFVHAPPKAIIAD